MKAFVRNMALFIPGLATMIYIAAFHLLIMLALFATLDSPDLLGFALLLVLGVPGLAVALLWAIGIAVVRALDDP